MRDLNNVRSPALPIAEKEYAKNYQDRYSNILRLYFNQIDNFCNGLLGPLGIAYFDAPYIAAQDSTDQYAGGDNTPTIVLWDTLDYGNGFTLNPNSTATALQSGIYKIDYSLQFANTDNTIHDVFVWLKINGSDAAGSASKFTLQARKSAGVYSFMVAYSSVVFNLNGGDNVGLWWATNKAYNPTGPIQGIYMEHQAAQTVPYAHPSVPSAVGSITFLSRSTP